MMKCQNCEHEYSNFWSDICPACEFQNGTPRLGEILNIPTVQDGYDLIESMGFYEVLDYIDAPGFPRLDEK
jgi:hypothetical protein